MFDGIAHRYDLLNGLMSMGLDKGWRRALVRSLEPALRGDDPRVLDVATGTADVALRIAREHPQTCVVGLDPSQGMLDIGRDKVAEDALAERIELILGDAQDMPFDDGAFNASCIAFGIRNVPDRAQGLAEMARVTAPGGRVSVLELTEPRSRVTRWYVHNVVPRLGAWFSRGDDYRYLQSSIEAFPPVEVFVEMMENAGLVDVEARTMGLGSVVLYVGTVPPLR